ncbi:FecR family protein [Agriterribacter sp.]|uniref:FecR family protein n=1 Tax=Agriterribacter sp. TaxID=2821509 RepID=UPI002B93DAE8|nr:FecR domain-containing protein [Agriterribacter sp.]HTN08561.1 FecR domain-containing protein [Agriterribacter sp.]
MEERIRYLLRQYENNKCSHEELEELFGYIRNARSSDVPLKRTVKKIYDDIRKNHPSFTYVDENGRLILTEPEQAFLPPKEAISGKNIKAPVWMILITGVVMIAAVFWIMRKDKPGNHATFRAGGIALTKKFSERSEQKFLLLPDSTEVWLNAASSLEFPDEFAGNKREVVLSGEAFFKVKDAEGMPFIIHTGKVSTVVLGTSLNIKAYPGERAVTVSVSEGKVNVKRNGNIVAILVKGQQVRMDNAGKKVDEKNIAASKVAAWMQGNMIYDDENFTDIIADLERIYNVNILISNKEVQSLHISTSFRKDTGISQALLTLCRLTGTKLHSGDRQFEIQ